MFPNLGLDPQSKPARGLRRYVELIEEMLGLAGQGSCVQLESPLGAYVAIEGHVPAFPERDVALLWDERHGWAIAVEAYCGEDLLVLSYLGGVVVPAPRVVARFVRRALAGEATGSPEPEVPAAPDLHDELAAYAPLAEELPPHGSGGWFRHRAGRTGGRRGHRCPPPRRAPGPARTGCASPAATCTAGPLLARAVDRHPVAGRHVRRTGARRWTRVNPRP